MQSVNILTKPSVDIVNARLFNWKLTIKSILQNNTKQNKNNKNNKTKRETCRFEHIAFEIKKLHDFGTIKEEFIVIDFSSTSEVKVIKSCKVKPDQKDTIVKILI